jgi:hypothetical protein
MELQSTCKCGATFHAKGLPANVGFRFREWLEAHQNCLKEEEITNADL